MEDDKFETLKLKCSMLPRYLQGEAIHMRPVLTVFLCLPSLQGPDLSLSGSLLRIVFEVSELT